MMKIISALVGGLLFIVSGVLSIALGFCAANNHSQVGGEVFLYIFAGFAICFVLVGAIFGAVLRIGFKVFTPLSFFCVVCFFGGLVFDLIKVPEGFKFIALAIVLVSVGLWIVRRPPFRR